MLEEVKTALGITGDYQDATISIYIEEVEDFLRGAGVPTAKITAGILQILNRHFIIGFQKAYHHRR